MKTIIVCVSVSNGNTRQVADAMAAELDASVVAPEDLDEEAWATADLVGIGSGIYGFRFHKQIRDLVDRLPVVEAKPIFVYWTSGTDEPPLWPYGRRLCGRLEEKGFETLGTFSCRGWDTWLPLRLVGGLNKGRPDEEDLARAREFASEIRDRVSRDRSEV